MRLALYSCYIPFVYTVKLNYGGSFSGRNSSDKRSWQSSSVISTHTVSQRHQGSESNLSLVCFPGDETGPGLIWQTLPEPRCATGPGDARENLGRCGKVWTQRGFPCLSHSIQIQTILALPSIVVRAGGSLAFKPVFQDLPVFPDTGRQRSRGQLHQASASQVRLGGRGLKTRADLYPGSDVRQKLSSFIWNWIPRVKTVRTTDELGLFQLRLTISRRQRTLHKQDFFL